MGDGEVSFPGERSCEIKATVQQTKTELVKGGQNPPPDGSYGTGINFWQNVES